MMGLKQILQKALEESEIWLRREKENLPTNEILEKGLNYSTGFLGILNFLNPKFVTLLKLK